MRSRAPDSCPLPPCGRRWTGDRALRPAADRPAMNGRSKTSPAWHGSASARPRAAPSSPSPGSQHLLDIHSTYPDGRRLAFRRSHAVAHHLGPHVGLGSGSRCRPVPPCARQFAWKVRPPETIAPRAAAPGAPRWRVRAATVTLGETAAHHHHRSRSVAGACADAHRQHRNGRGRRCKASGTAAIHCRRHPRPTPRGLVFHDLRSSVAAVHALE